MGCSETFFLPTEMISAKPEEEHFVLRLYMHLWGVERGESDSFPPGAVRPLLHLTNFKDN
jgi:hypothetical protein